MIHITDVPSSIYLWSWMNNVVIAYNHVRCPCLVDVNISTICDRLDCSLVRHMSGAQSQVCPSGKRELSLHSVRGAQIRRQEIRDGRMFLCLSRWYLAHADQNAYRSMTDTGMHNLGRSARCGRLDRRAKHVISDFPAMSAKSAHVRGRLDGGFMCWLPNEPSSIDGNVAVRDGHTLA